jgi:hypothetical protein
LFDRFYLTQHWLLPDMLSHQLHTLVLVFLAPITWACVAPHMQTGARSLRANAIDVMRVPDPSRPDWSSALPMLLVEVGSPLQEGGDYPGAAKNSGERVQPQSGSFTAGARE